MTNYQIITTADIAAKVEELVAAGKLDKNHLFRTDTGPAFARLYKAAREAGKRLSLHLRCPEDLENPTADPWDRHSYVSRNASVVALCAQIVIVDAVRGQFRYVKNHNGPTTRTPVPFAVGTDFTSVAFAADPPPLQSNRVPMETDFTRLKDGEAVVVAWLDDLGRQATFVAHRYQDRWWAHGYVIATPTHWAPLPQIK